MKTIALSIPDMLIIYGLMALPLMVYMLFQLPLIRKTAIALIRMTVQLMLVGIYLKYIFTINHPALTLGWIGCMILVANYTVLQQAGLNFKRLFIITLPGLVLSTGVVVGVFVLIALRPQPLYDARYLVPITGMVLGNCLRGNIVALERFYSGIANNLKEYQTYLFLGATRAEACRPYMRTALTAALTPTISTMATMGIVSLPGMMTGQILGGSLPTTAIMYQIAIMVSIIGAVALAAALNIMLSAQVAFNHYGNLRTTIFTKNTH